MHSTPNLKRTRLSRSDMLLLAASLLIAATYFKDVENNPVGFFVDEASIAYNAHTISQHGSDENGHGFPLYFRAFGEYKSPVYIYVLAALFRFTGPSIFASRLLSAVAGLAAAVLLGLLGARLTRRRIAGFLVFISAALTPWIFEISRLVFEVSLFPFLLALFLLFLHVASKERHWSRRSAVVLGALLGLMFYTYSVGRLLAPFFALGLIFFVTRTRWRGVVLTWAVFGLTLLPFAVFTLRHPGALSERFKHVSFIKPEHTRAEILGRFVQNYARNFSPRSWLVSGDPEPRHHLPGMGSLLIGVVILAALGIVVVLVWHTSEAWWRFILYCLAVSPIPASLTLDHFHTLRLIGIPVFLLVLTAPAIEFLLGENGEWRNARRASLTALVLAILLQGSFFQWRFRVSPPRVEAFDSYYQELLATALRRPERPINLLDKTPAAYVYAYWYATLQGLELTNFRRASVDEPIPHGALVISHELPCTNCEIIIERGQFRVYVQK
jgi:4-amino-4-deoxy-L-arabinose transferase-like glycosyltransferase